MLASHLLVFSSIASASLEYAAHDFKILGSPLLSPSHKRQFRFQVSVQLVMVMMMVMVMVMLLMMMMMMMMMMMQP